MFVIGAKWGCLDIFPLAYHFSFLSPSLYDGWVTWDFTSFSKEFKLYQEDGMEMDNCALWYHVYD